MREILFRGKWKNNGAWVYGGFHSRFGRAFIIGISKSIRIDGGEVFPDTVGQYTGLPDKNGERIFEGDIVTGLFLFGLSVNAVVTFQNGAFGLEWHRGNIKTFDAFTSICNVEYQVIGNIHDNPELFIFTKT